MGAGLALLSAAAVWAISTRLEPGATQPVPATTAAAERDLAGASLYNALLPFVIKAPGGVVLCEGNLQNSVDRSNTTGFVHFYYRIRDTKGVGAVDRILTSSFGVFLLGTAFRTDGEGSVAPTEVTRSAGSGDRVQFDFAAPGIDCAKHEESQFVVIKTAVENFGAGGETQIFAATGPRFTVRTVVPK